MTVREQLHELIDALDEDRLDFLLVELEAEQAVNGPALTAEELDRIDRSMREARAGLGRPVEEVRRHLGLPG